MSTDIKNRNTLLRFQSIRNPELPKKEGRNNRFVFHPQNEKPLIETDGGFFTAVKNKPATQSKKEALTSFCNTFVGYTTEKDLKNIDETFFDAANWLAINKSKVSDAELYNKISSVANISSETALEIWDNLFYQTTTNKTFYVKENCIQMLVLHNLLVQIEDLDKTEAVPLMKSLANARVVLPISLFEEEEIVANTTATKIGNSQKETVVFANKELLDAQETAISKVKIEDYETVIDEVQKVSKKFQKQKQAEFLKQEKSYQEKIKPIIKEYQTQYNSLKREMCKLPRPENYDPNDFCNQPDIEYPELPEFIFEFQNEVQSNFLQENLSENTFTFLSENVNLKEVETFDEIISILNKKKEVEHQNIFAKTQFSQKVMSIGGFSFPLNSTAKTTTFPFRICPNFLLNNSVNFNMVIQMPDNSYDATGMIYHMHYTDGTNTNGYFQQSKSGNTITLTKIYGISGLSNVGQTVVSFNGQITFTKAGQNIVFDFNIQPFDLKQCFNGFLTNGKPDDNSNPTSTDNFIPKGFGFRQLGIADYKKIVSHVCCYDAGEVAHIENVMAKEIREKITTKTHKSEVTNFSSSEVETEKMSDTTSTERFEMQTEIAKLMQEDKQMEAHANYSGAVWGGVLDVGASYASNTSKEESNRQAVTQGKELTQRAMERIVTRIKNEKTVKITDEFTEVNKHGFDNTQGDHHVSGVFRFINATYKNQIYNYGKRLSYEFMIPQPAKLHTLGMAVSSADSNAVILEKPIDPRIIYPSFTAINNGNYQGLAALYGADVKICPDQNMIVGKILSFNVTQEQTAQSGKDAISIPDGYETIEAKITLSGSAPGGNWSWGRGGVVTVGDYKKGFGTNLNNDTAIYQSVGNYIKEIPISYWTTNFYTLTASVSVSCQLTNEGLINWQKETYNKIIEGYNTQLENYNNNLASAKASGIQITESNPLFYRQIEQLILKKDCISYLIDDSNPLSNRRFGQKMYNDNATFMNHQVTLNQKMDNYTSFAKFMEQAFDWNLMSYNFYPYYWANREDWDDLYQSQINDPLFRSFMQSGMARVVVTVKPGFEDAVMHYMSFGQIWNGGQMPVIGNPLYLSIVDELKEQEYVVEETWETVVPTSLIALQESGVAVHASGLPCGDGCENHAVNGLIPNLNKLGDNTKTISLNDIKEA